ncbi:MAG: helix-turn-helix domain-containing protein [Rubrobacter sp.]|nr:helix-turn-helix domain-containing protein [Rubrobacter sp.]
MIEFNGRKQAKESDKMPTLAELEKWLTTGQTASKLGKSRQGVTWLVENKRIRAVKTQAGWLIDPKAVENYAERSE